MSITAKELAKMLNLSAPAVSMALNNKPGVSIETKNRVLEAAEQYGYDFSRLSSNKSIKAGSIYVIWYHGNNAILKYSPIFDEMLNGIEMECRKLEYSVKTLQFFEKFDDLNKIIEDLRISDCIGILLLGTELEEARGKDFLALNLPVVVLDSNSDLSNCNHVTINNYQGAYQATDYLISRYQEQPGHLQATYQLMNFSLRKKGYKDAIKDNGMSTSSSIVHKLPPSIEGAMSDMLEIIDSGIPLARSYFADNDLIALGAIKAFKVRNYKIPEDVAIIGFDNIPEGRIIEPSLTTIDYSRIFMAQIAVRTLIDCIKNPSPHTFKISVSTKLVKRYSA
jgi:LacI family transcriptional regulator